MEESIKFKDPLRAIGPVWEASATEFGCKASAKGAKKEFPIAGQVKTDVEGTPWFWNRTSGKWER